MGSPAWTRSPARTSRSAIHVGDLQVIHPGGPAGGGRVSGLCRDRAGDGSRVRAGVVAHPARAEGGPAGLPELLLHVARPALRITRGC